MLHHYLSIQYLYQSQAANQTDKMTNQWSNKRFKSMTTSSPSPLNSSMHTTCTPAAQVQARDAGRRYKKLCVEMSAERDTEWRQGHGVQSSSQRDDTTNDTQNMQSSSFQASDNLLKEW